MADEKSGIFTRKAEDKLRSPDDLDEYVRVTNPGVWVVLAACIALVAGLFTWAFLGTAETSVSATGTCVEGEVVCFLPPNKAANVHEGDVANVNGELMTVSKIGTVPVSRVEVDELVKSDYLVDTLVSEDWSYPITFSGDAKFTENIPLSVTITTERIAPISLIFKGEE